MHKEFHGNRAFYNVIAWHDCLEQNSTSPLTVSSLCLSQAEYNLPFRTSSVITHDKDSNQIQNTDSLLAKFRRTKTKHSSRFVRP